MSEKINFLFKKFNITPSTSTDISSNLLETFDASGRRIIFNEDIYSEIIPTSLPNFNISFYYISSVDVAKVEGTTTIVSMNGFSNSYLVSTHGLTDEIWQAFRDSKISRVDYSSSNPNFVKINDLVTDYISDTNSIQNSPSYFHLLLQDCIPNTIHDQIYDISIKGKDSSNNIISFSNNLNGDWIVQSDCGIIQFFDQNSILTDESGINHTMFDTTSDLSSNSLFNKQKTPIISFYKYIGLKGLGIQRTSNVVFKLPSVDGIPGTFLKTDGYGNLSFDANSGSSGSGSSLWTANGSKIYYNHNNVGIGTSNPEAKLSILDTSGGFIFYGANSNYNLIKSHTIDNAIGKDLLISTNDSANAGLYIQSATGSNNGNIGIGTNNPSSKLHVVGNGNITGDLNVGSLNTITSTEIGYLNGLTGSIQTQINNISNNSIIWNKNINDIYYNLGKVSIGTNNFNNKLTVKVSTDYDGISLVNEFDNYIVKLARNIAGHGYVNIYNSSGAARTSFLAMDKNIFLDKVAIGNSSPSYDLDVSGTGNFSQNLTVTSINNITSTELGYLDGLTSNIQTQINNISSGSSPWTTSGNNIYYNLGNIGINTSSPSEKLEVNGNIKLLGSIITSTIILSQTELGYLNGITSSIQTQIDNKVSSQWLTNSNKLYYNTDNVGIGTNNPEEKLHVSGNIKYNGSLVNSDDRLKHNEIDIKNGLEEIRKMIPKKYFKTEEMYDESFNFVVDENNNPIDENGNIIDHFVEVGLIAQDLLKIPSLSFNVAIGKNNQPHSVRYNNIFMYSIAAIKEIDETINEIHDTINDIDKTINNIKLSDYKNNFDSNVFINADKSLTNNYSDLLIGSNSNHNIFPSSSNRLSFRTPAHGRYFTWKTNDPDGTYSDLQLLINFDEKSVMTWRNNYKVGINNNTPEYTLDVIGDINFTGNIYKNGNIYGSSLSDSKWEINSNSIYNISTNVAIGTDTNTDDSKLEINGVLKINENNKGILMGPNPNHSIHFNNSYNKSENVLDFYEFGDIRFFTGGNKEIQTEKMRIESNGNIGINNKNPIHKLDINGSLNLTGQIYQNGKLYVSPNIHKTEFYVSVTTKSINNKYYNKGSLVTFIIDSQESPVIQFKINNKYRFNQYDSTNFGHQIKFYEDENKNKEYTENVTYYGISGNSGSFTEIIITENTPIKLYYQSVNEQYMGNYGVVEISFDKITVKEMELVNNTIKNNELLYSDIYNELIQSNQWKLNGSNLNYTNGNVGIGIITPTERLQINEGNIKITNTITNQPKLVLEKNMDENNIILEYNGEKSYENDYFSIYSGNNGWSTKGSSLNIIPYNGRVGIGTINPQSLLEVNGEIRAAYNADTTSYFGNSAIGYSDHSDHASFSHIDNNNKTDYSLIQNNIGDTYLNCKTGQSIEFRENNNNKVIIKNGNLGISKENPEYKLDVDGNINFSGSLLKNGSKFNLQHKTEFNVEVKQKTDSHPYYQLGSEYAFYIDGEESPVLQFKSGKTYRFRQGNESNKNQQIVFSLDPNKNNLFNNGVEYFGIAGEIGSYTEIKITDSTPTKIYYQSSTDQLLGNYSSIEISVENLTNIEIGYLNGVSGNIQSQINNIASPSDDRLKHNEEIITNGLELLRKLNPKKYIKTSKMYQANHNFELDDSNNPIDENGNNIDYITEIGLIAQEILNIPELSFCVVKGNENYPHSVRYNNLFALTISALKQLDSIYSSTKNQLDNKINDIDNLKNELAAEKEKTKTLQFQMSDLINRIQVIEKKVDS